ncbi:MAG: CoF synthetase [Thermoanaerobaculia bacterium]|nr:CoF synthetase [Thermoanaerobaculia bacterium]
MIQALTFLSTYFATRRRRFLDRAALEAWQARRLKRALERARRVFPFYRKVVAAELADFPVLDKPAWLENFASLNDHGLELEACLRLAREAEARRDFTARLGGVAIGLSTGTSGRQGVFLTSPAERARWAGTVLAKALPAGLLAGARVALVLRAGGPLYEAVGGRRVRFRFFDLARPLDDHAAELAAFAPTVLVAPPQALVYLAALRRAGGLAIRPATIYSVAEVLEPRDRAAIEGSFGGTLHEIYQATEGFLGITCRLGRLHLNEDLLFFEREWLDRTTRRFVPIVTDLFRTTQAIVRYRLGDVLVAAAEPCPCGSPMTAIERIEGRTDDLLRLPGAVSGDLKSVFPDFVRGAVLGVPGMEDFRLVQESPDHLVLAVRPPELQDQAAAALAQLFQRDGLRVPEITAGEFKPFRPEVKLRRVRSVLGGLREG